MSLWFLFLSNEYYSGSLEEKSSSLDKKMRENNNCFKEIFDVMIIDEDNATKRSFASIS